MVSLTSEATTEGEDAWIPPVLASAAATSATTAVAPQSYGNSISSSSTAVFPRPGEGVVTVGRSSRRQAGGGRRPAEGGGGLSRCDV